MGWEWEVECWVNLGDGYAYRPLYTGNSKREMKRAVKEARRQGIGAIRTTWRPA